MWEVDVKRPHRPASTLTAVTTPAQPPPDPTLTDALAVDPWPGAPIHGTIPIHGSVPIHRSAPVPAIQVPAEPQAHVVYVERPRRRRWPWVFGALAVAFMVCGVLGLAVTAPIRAEYPAVVTIPEATVAGFTVAHTSEYDTQTAELERRIRQEQGVNDAFARVLVDPAAAARPVFFFGATRLILDPDGDLTKAMRDLTNAAQIKAYDPGSLGGKLRCGNFTGEDGKPAVACAWIDHGSVGVGVCPGGRPMDDCAAALRRIRAEVLIRP